MQKELKSPGYVFLQVLFPALLLLGFLIFLLVWRDVVNTESRYHKVSKKVYETILRRADEGETVLRGLATLYQSTTLRKAQLKKYASEMNRLYSHIYAVTILDRVSSDSLQDYLFAIENTDKRIASLKEGSLAHPANRVPIKRREMYFPFRYVVSAHKNASHILDYDAYSNPVMAAALKHAIVSSVSSASFPLRLPGGEKVIFVFRAAYAMPRLPATTESRMKAAYRVAAVSLRVDQLIDAGIMGGNADVRILHSDTGVYQGKTFFRSDATNKNHGLVIRRFDYQQNLGLFGLPLMLKITLPVTLSDIIWVDVGFVTLLWMALVTLFFYIINSRYNRHAEQQAAREELVRERKRADVTLRSLTDAVITTDINGYLEYMNPVAERLTGWQLHEAKGKSLEEVVEFVDETSNSPHPNPLRECIGKGVTRKSQGEVALRQRTGDLNSIDYSIAPMWDANRRVMGAILVFQDVGAERMMSKLLNYQASHDDLTGLYNRREFERRLSEALAECGASSKCPVVFYVDLDQFKIVNDTCGHIAGDIVLRQVAELFKTQIREDETLARVGGDEFGVLLTGYDLESAKGLAEEMIDVVRKYRFTWDEKVFEIGASIGIVHIDENMKTLSEVLSNADAACYQAKERGGNQLHLYHIEDSELLDRKKQMHWVQKISQAFSESRFVLYAQGIYPLQARDHIEHYEILMRMMGDNGEVIAPTDFIAAAERYRVMTDIDRWVIRSAIGHISEYVHRKANEELPEQHFSINLSGQSLSSTRMSEYVADLLHEYPEVTDKLIFEITETAAISNLEYAINFIDRFSEMGVRFSLDDFGSGVSSFSYLKNLHVDYLKIDGSFVKDMASDPVDYAMVRSINHIGHVLNIQTIAEHVESKEVLESLKEVGVDYIQGNWKHRPESLQIICRGGRDTGEDTVKEKLS